MPYFTNDMQHEVERIIRNVKSKVYTKVAELDMTAYKTKEPVPYDEKTSGEKFTPKKGERWGELWDCAWFNLKGTVPAECKGKSVVLMIDISGEACIFDGNGTPVRGLTNASSGFDYSLGRPGKRIYKFKNSADGGEDVDIWLDGANNDLFGAERGNGAVVDADIAVCNEKMRELYYDMWVLFDAAKAIDNALARSKRILFKLYEVACMMKKYDDAEIDAAFKILKPELKKKNGDVSLKLTAIGHAHIDLAWLWPIRESKRKGARTFSTAIELMDRYPDYKFGASQPQLYEWMKELYPALYAKIKEKVKEGRWELQGAMWVESDTNVVSGESLVRQILYGKKFYKDEFGADVNHLWLPDVFGYSGALPQILKKSGVDYFMTQKMSWNSYNKFPHHTFVWKGIDKSSVVAHMLPEETYNSPISPSFMLRAEKNYADAGICDEALVLFGIGDGGGGPGPEHLEKAKRIKNFNGLPTVEQGFAADLFTRLGKYENKLPVWVGELYLERHQGTYTTQAKNKKFNRLIEQGLRELELALIMSGEYKNESYPKEFLDKTWKEMLLYQFHDIIPGSSIKRVYDESVARYEEMHKEINDKIAENYNKTIKSAPVKSAFNSLSWGRQETLTIDGENYTVTLPALASGTLQSAKTTKAVKSGNMTIENSIIKVKFNKDGSISSIYDKKNALEAVEGRANILAVYEDIGDCWDMRITYKDKTPEEFILESQTFGSDGVFAFCEQIYKYGSSTLKQKISICEGKNIVEFDTSVEWNENDRMLRAKFPTTVQADFASYEIQFGKLNRPNHENTTLDKARYETCGHKWVDLSQRDFGVALLNDCKYGYNIIENVIDINLLRSQNYPGKDADKGTQSFRYAIYLHKGDETEADVARKAYEFNCPVKFTADGEGPNIPLIETTGNLLLETVKRGEDGNTIILRSYDPYGIGGKTIFKPNIPFAKAFLTNLMEETISELPVQNGEITVQSKPFEIITVKLSQ